MLAVYTTSRSVVSSTLLNDVVDDSRLVQHGRPRPKSMRNPHGEGRAQVTRRQDHVDMFGQALLGTFSLLSHRLTLLAARCYNCHTTATLLWRKDDEGKTVCNAYVDLFGFGFANHHDASPSHSIVVADCSEYISLRSYFD